jgi:hypothetical protein
MTEGGFFAAGRFPRPLRARTRELPKMSYSACTIVLETWAAELLLPHILFRAAHWTGIPRPHLCVSVRGATSVQFQGRSS